MARPRKQPAEQRVTRLTTRVTPAELAHVEHQARTAGLTAAEFLRRLALGATVISRRPRGDDAMLVELNRIGVNINQLARAANSGMPPASADLRAALAQLHRVLQALHRCEGGPPLASGGIDAGQGAGDLRGDGVGGLGHGP
jgi:Bacterial mobilisation protein (MobC)